MTTMVHNTTYHIIGEPMRILGRNKTSFKIRTKYAFVGGLGYYFNRILRETLFFFLN